MRWAKSLPKGWARYAIFMTVVVLSAISPAVPHSITPDVPWWLGAWGCIVLMVLAGYLAGTVQRGSAALAVLAPLLLFPVIWCLRCSDGNSMSGFTPLIFLPVLWFALYGSFTAVAVAATAAALTMFLPVFIVGSPEYPSSSWRGYVLLLIVVCAAGPLIHRLVESTRRANLALTRSESEFRAAFEDAPVGMAITSLDSGKPNRFVRVNHALCTMFGRTGEELTGTTIIELTHPDDVPLTQHRFNIATDLDAPRRIQKRYLHKSGRPIWVSVTYSVVHDEHGNPAHLVSQIEDVTARHESDKALLDAFETDLAATERMNRIDRIRADMASTVSHELRTPLTSAAGYVELLVEGDAGPLTSEQRMMLDTVSRSLARLDRIVDDVLSIATQDGPAPAQEAVVTNLSVILHAAISTVSIQAAKNGQDLVVHDDLDGAEMDGDPGRLERVLVNLLTNAVKFTGDDGLITVTGIRNGDTAVISVADNGIGIAADDVDRIFERFYRADQRSAPKAPGSGLGLSIVSAITTQYGGQISVDSELGKGSTFTVTLPLRPKA